MRNFTKVCWQLLPAVAAVLRLRVGVVPGEPLPGARAPVPLHAPGPRLPRLRAAGLSGAGRWDNRC